MTPCNTKCRLESRLHCNANANLSIAINDENTALHIASMSKVGEIVLSLLIEKGDPLYPKNKNKEIPFITALSSYSCSMMIAKAMKGT